MPFFVASPLHFVPVSLTTLDLMNLRFNALFTHDEEGRVCFVNEPDGARAPRFCLGRTRAGATWRFRDDVPASTVTRIEALCRDEPGNGDLRVPPRHARRYRAILEACAPIGQEWAGPAYHFPATLPPPGAALVRLDATNAHLLRGGSLEPWIADIGHNEPLLALVCEGRAVSVCASVRITPAAHEAGVETASAFRGRGFAPAVVAGWARAVRALGGEPFYSTSWQNAASQAVAHKLGLIPFGSDFHVT